MRAHDILLQVYVSVDLPTSNICVGGQVEYRGNSFHRLCQSWAVKNITLNQFYSSLTEGELATSAVHP